jgi:hypothetical protein
VAATDEQGIKFAFVWLGRRHYQMKPEYRRLDMPTNHLVFAGKKISEECCPGR